MTTALHSPGGGTETTGGSGGSRGGERERSSTSLPQRSTEAKSSTEGGQGWEAQGKYEAWGGGGAAHFPESAPGFPGSGESPWRSGMHPVNPALGFSWAKFNACGNS